MPTYEYYCQTCDQNLEVFQSMKDAPLTRCDCGKRGKVKRLIGTGSGLIFKGSGFYETDYKRAGQTTAAASTGSSDKSAGKAEKTETPKPATAAKAD